jgi:hypothetical protein
MSTLQQKLLDHAFGGPSYTRATTLYVGLSTTEIMADGTGATEPSGGAYARVALTNDGTSWAAAATDATAAVKLNAAAIQFPAATAGWGTISYFFVVDDADTVLAWGALGAPLTVITGDVFVFGIGALEIRLE